MRRALSFLLLAALPAFGESITDLLCTSEVPENEYGVPVCSDYEMNSMLIAAVEENDPSALALLEQRYAQTDTYKERQRIARVLLRRVQNDTAIWNDILKDAQLAVRFADVDGEPPEEFSAWCEQRGFNPYEHGDVIDRAFSIAAEDPRGHALLVRALDSEERNLALTAASQLALDDDTASLDGIERVLQRFHWDSFSLAAVIDTMSDPRAKALAKKYLEEDEEEP